MSLEDDKAGSGSEVEQVEDRSGPIGLVDPLKRTGVFTKAEKKYSTLREGLHTALHSAISRLGSVHTPEVVNELGSFEGDRAFDAYCKTAEFRIKVGLITMGHISSQDVQPLALSSSVKSEDPHTQCTQYTHIEYPKNVQ